MSSTASGAGKTIIFISNAHEKFYYEKLKFHFPMNKAAYILQRVALTIFTRINLQNREFFLIMIAGIGKSMPQAAQMMLIS